MENENKEINQFQTLTIFKYIIMLHGIMVSLAEIKLLL